MTSAANPASLKSGSLPKSASDKLECGITSKRNQVADPTVRQLRANPIRRLDRYASGLLK
jgi:hypothetical protein